MRLGCLHEGVSSSAFKDTFHFVDLQHSDTICYRWLLMRLFSTLLNARGTWNHIVFLGRMIAISTSISVCAHLLHKGPLCSSKNRQNALVR